jgi:hypothetical protein
MQTIITKLIRTTSTKPARIVATNSAGGSKVTLSWDSLEGDTDSRHAAVAMALAKHLGWAGTWVGGASADGRGLTFVCSGAHAISFNA